MSAPPSCGPLPVQPAALVLDNGVRGLCVERPHSPTFALQLFARAGSRHDGRRPGLAHLVEHLVFRAPRAGRPDLFAVVEGRGGEVGATTTRDYMSFSLVVAAPDAERALALLPALVRPPAIDRASLRGERQVIGHELRERVRPADALWDLLLAALWGDVPLARPPGGSLAALADLTATAAAAFHARRFSAPHLLVVGAGACPPAAFAAALRAALDDLPLVQGASPAVAPQARPSALEACGGGTGSYVAVGIAVPGVEHPDSAALRLLEGVLGQGPGSRLGRALAARGLTAAVQTRCAAYAGVGVFAALAATPAANGEAVAAALETEVRSLAARPPTATEIRMARRRQWGALYRRCESNAGLASALGTAALFGPAHRPPEAALPESLPVAGATVRRAAREHLATAPFARATLHAGGG
ncbi:MAG TPA: insulinase family protein [Chloroflexota bacterium]|nr:insulinase family protein [Chloroflexota bacterium]